MNITRIFLLSGMIGLCEIRTKVRALKKYLGDDDEEYNSCWQETEALKEKLHESRELISDARKNIAVLYDEVGDFKKILLDAKKYAENSKHRDSIENQMQKMAAWRTVIEREAKDVETNVIHVVSRRREELLTELRHLRRDHAVFEKNKDVGTPPDLLSEVRFMVDVLKRKGQELMILNIKPHFEDHHRKLGSMWRLFHILKPHAKNQYYLRTFRQDAYLLKEKIDGVIDSISDHNEDVDRLINEITDFQKMLDLEISRYKGVGPVEGSSKWKP